MKRVNYFFTICLSFLLSCSEDIVPSPYTYTKVFTGENSKTWAVKFLEETLDGKVIDRFTISCASDDKYIFYANAERKYEALTGTKKCYATPEANKIENVWSFTNSTATLTMLLPFFSTTTAYPFIVREADSNTMELEIFLDEANTQSYRIHFESIAED